VSGRRIGELLADYVGASETVTIEVGGLVYVIIGSGNKGRDSLPEPLPCPRSAFRRRVDLEEILKIEFKVHLSQLLSYSIFKVFIYTNAPVSDLLTNIVFAIT